MRVLRDLRSRGLAGPDRPHRLVGDDQPLVRRDAGELALEHRLRLPCLALGLRLTDAGDDVQARLESRLRPSPDRLVRLAKELPALGVPDDGARHAEFGEHRRRYLARERALELPVDVLCEDARRAVRTEALQRRLERDVRRAHDDIDVLRPEAPDLRRVLARLVQALVHLPVPGNEHVSILVVRRSRIR